MSCPDAEVLAAFVEGKLSGSELESVAQHLREHEECRHVVGEVARLEREEVFHPPAKSQWWLAAAAAIVIAAAIGGWWWRGQPASGIDTLIAAAPTTQRAIEPRLSGFPWARLSVVRGPQQVKDPQQMVLVGAAGQVIKSNASAHAAGVAYLITDDPSGSVRRLTEATKESNDARTWSDLAAAQYVLGSDDQLALYDAGEALKRNPNLPEANFNRALILERLGLTIQARDAWQHYLQLDPGSDWANEAREHLKKLEIRGRVDFKKELQQAAATGRIDELVRREPQNARVWGEGPLLAAWAKSRSAEELEIVAEIAQSLAAANGEMLLTDHVAIIRHASGARLEDLANAHRLYAAGRADYSKRLASIAEKELTDAAALFGRAGSPMRDVALYFAANTIFDQNRAADARTILEKLLDRVESGRHHALYAQELWQLARCDAFAGAWSSSLDHALSSMKVFAALGERTNEANVRSLAADIHEYMGEPQLAKRLRVAATDVLSREAAKDRVASMLANSVRTNIRFDNQRDALAVADLAVPELRDSPILLADVLLNRARIAPTEREAEDSLARARLAAARIPDPSLRRRAEIDLMVVEGARLRASNPAESIRKLTESIEFYRRENFIPWIADGLLERARSYIADGNDPLALRDLQTGIEQVEAQRSIVRDPGTRAVFLDTEPRLYEEAVALLLRDREPKQAFEMAERAKAKTLRENAGMREARIPERQAIIEYAFIPAGVAIFCVRTDAIVAKEVPVDRATLREDIAQLQRDLQDRAPLERVRRDAANLDAILIAPIRDSLIGVENIVCIPDRELERVPFGVLVDGASGQYRIEQFAITIAPSAAFGVRKEAAERHALIVGDPLRDKLAPLPDAAAEASTLAKLYPGATLLTGAAAKRTRFIEMARDAAIIHFAGHAVGDEDQPSALALSGDDLSAAEIARLRLPRTQLVVLAACGSARGPAHVEGTDSLARAFLTAGVSAVVGTAWEVDDRLSAPLFEMFHQHYAAGLSPARALQLAQIAALRSADAAIRHPATWAPIAVLGTAEN